MRSVVVDRTGRQTCRHSCTGACPRGVRNTRRAATKFADEGTVGSPAIYLTPPRILYPAQAKREGQQGQVIVGVLVRKNGDIGEVRVVQGSGYALLDEAAVRGMRTASFQPARIEGQNVDAWFKAPVNFRLGS